MLFAVVILTAYDCIKGDEYGNFGKTIWVMLIIVFPLIGILLYYFGSRRKNRNRIRGKYERLKKANEAKSS